MRCEYLGGRSMGSTRVGVGDDSVTQSCAGSGEMMTPSV